MLTSLFPYLNFDGNAKEATHFYVEALDGELLGITTFGEAPNDETATREEFSLPPGVEDLIMNAQIRLENGAMLMTSDVFPGREYHTGNNLSLTLTYDDVEEARAVFKRLAQDGSIGMELQQTFWSPLYGSLIDRYGIEWQISVDAV
ncbi:VOC family protein [Trichococcus collinsii]|uniref:PhnB protein n=1 Tax=Trichococcus collinsii TaxID=157076 RepID=A0AB37ZZJ7_9LACT|nr:VOC family protein [Trichococcus collinsii]CZR09245.1 glyoxalase/bleomycin resistance protein/dihydroxybiphenyl dioxygenase [Trichococcus collinsii]SEA16685.1 PhnB protein [Trichococcus collinsii]